MKLLLDNNLSPKLIEKLADIFPDSSHVALLGLERASDSDVWDAAHQQGYTLVSKDADFNELLTTKGFPPKVVFDLDEANHVLQLVKRSAITAAAVLKI